jgi:hypothetical protein
MNTARTPTVRPEPVEGLSFSFPAVQRKDRASTGSARTGLGGQTLVIPAKAGISRREGSAGLVEIPASAGMTARVRPSAP